MSGLYLKIVIFEVTSLFSLNRKAVYRQVYTQTLGFSNNNNVGCNIANASIGRTRSFCRTIIYFNYLFSHCKIMSSSTISFIINSELGPLSVRTPRRTENSWVPPRHMMHRIHNPVCLGRSWKVVVLVSGVITIRDRWSR